MATITVMSWNIQIYGQKKFLQSPNNVQLLNTISAIAENRFWAADILCVMEIRTPVRAAVTDALQSALPRLAEAPWAAFSTPARANGNLESYAFFWRTDRAFTAITDGAGNIAAGLASNEFPNNFSAKKGRKAAYIVFRTTDTSKNFVVSLYHAPPKAPGSSSTALQEIGLDALAAMPELASVDRNGSIEAIDAHFLCGDYNLDLGNPPNPSYANLMNVTHTVPALSAGTGTILLSTPPDPPPTNPNLYLQPLALDNILFTAGGGHGASSGIVINLIDELGSWRKTATMPAAQGRLSAMGAGFITRGGALAATQKVTLPLNRPFKAYRLAKAISDHLPILVTSNI